MSSGVNASPKSIADRHHNHSGHPPSSAPADRFAAEMQSRMHAMMQAMDAVGTTGEPDRDFLAMMIPHHQGAVDMARLVLVHGRDPLTRQLAQEIIASQQAEIGSMRARLERLERGDARDADGFPALGGTRGH
jgi:uncharacterized protein (DUF305 family)